MPCEFRHRDQLSDIDGIDAGRLPAVYRWADGGWAMCLSPEAIKACETLDDLKQQLAGHCLHEE